MDELLQDQFADWICDNYPVANGETLIALSQYQHVKNEFLTAKGLPMDTEL